MPAAVALTRFLPSDNLISAPGKKSLSASIAAAFWLMVKFLQKILPTINSGKVVYINPEFILHEKTKRQIGP
jgi:hypothetical protein